MSQQYKKPVIREDDLINNPFIANLDILVNRVGRYGVLEKDKDGDYLPAVVDLEYESPVRFYVSSKRRMVLNNLSSNAAKLLQWCMQRFENSKDWFWLNKSMYMNETGVAYNTYKKSIKELQDQCLFLKTSYTDVFWISPHYFFRGNRARFYSKHEGVVKLYKDSTRND